MRTVLTRALWLAIAFSLSSAAVARADDPTPVPTSAPIIVPTEIPTIPVAVSTPTPVVEVSPPQQDSTPVTVVREHSTPVTSIEQTPVTLPTAATDTIPTVGEGVPGPGPSVPPPVISSTSSPSSGTAPSAPVPVDTSTSGSSISASSAPTLDLTAPSVSAQAPAELSCSSATHPVAGPFLVSPFHGWTEVASFLDHDRPDYSIDGKIVIANGLTADASNGQESDVFPAYWSPTLRQFINYDGHNGYDFAISYQPVYAAAAGTVQFAGWSNSGYGNMILINHHNGYVTLYGHLSQLDVQSGDRVSTGQEIAISGSTGNSTGPHLHFSVFHDCNVADPYGWTGSGADPLQAFSGAPSSYLWLPGHDPLLLNPPPDWPSFPAGLSIRIPPTDIGIAAQQGALPPADRLLLLDLPAPGQAGSADPGLALAETEAVISSEAQKLAPQLVDLQAQGLVQSYQLIPSAGAIWIHGTASAQELEGLNGVASLSGAEPRDLIAAEQGLAHAVLIEMGRQEAPSLWPSGFRSGLHTWRPVTTFLVGNALVAGYGLPGSNVSVSLSRGDSVLASATATADPDSGGFVATLQDALGNPIAVQVGDTIEVDAGGRTSRVVAQPLSVSARRDLVFGSASPSSSLSLSVLPPGGSSDRGFIASGVSGRFLESLSHPFTAGTLVVVGTSDGAGNHEAASGFVPGFVAVEGSGLVSGWVVGNNPRLRVSRHGHVLSDRSIKASSDGAFQMELTSHGVPVTLLPGDVVSIGSKQHSRSVTLPVLSAPVPHGADLRVQGPVNATVQLSFQPAGREGWTRVENLGASGTAHAPVAGPTVPGDRTIVTYVMPSGDTVESIDEARGILVHEGTARIDGKTRPGSIISFHALNASGRQVGSAVASTGLSGEFHVVVRSARGRTIRLSSARTLVVRDDRSTTRFSLPLISITLDRSESGIDVLGPPRSQLYLLHWGWNGIRSSVHIDTNAAGTARAPLTLNTVQRLSVRWIGPGGLTVERVAVNHDRPQIKTGSETTAPCKKTSHTVHGSLAPRAKCASGHPGPGSE